MGLLFFLFFSLVTGSIVAYPLGLGRMGGGWHLAIGAAGTALGWVFVLFLRFPELMTIGVSGWDVYPLWAALGSLIIGIVISLMLPQDRVDWR